MSADDYALCDWVSSTDDEGGLHGVLGYYTADPNWKVLGSVYPADEGDFIWTVSDNRSVIKDGYAETVEESIDMMKLVAKDWLEYDTDETTDD